MADPIVTITNGIPVSSVPATGTITTLGQTLVDGANVALGATTDAAATGVGTVNAHLRSIATNISSGISVSGTITANQGGAPWTVKPDGAAWTQTGTSANVNVTNGSIAVTGTFFQATQPISAVSLPLPSGAATAVKQPALGTAGSASADVITVQGIASMTALKVDGSAVTQPVSGTVTVQQATAANLNATVTGTIAATQSGNWTSRVVGNAGGIMDFAGQNAAAPANSLLIGGEFNTTPTTIVSGNASPLQLDSTGNLKVSASGTVTANQGGTWSVRLQDGAGNAITSDTRGSARPLAVEILDSAGSQITSFGGSNASVSATAAAVPASATYIGANQGGNLVGLTGTGGSLNVNITGGAGSGGTAMADEAAFTFGTTQGTPAMGVFQTTATSNALTSGQAGTWQMTANRAGFVNLRTATGTEIGTSTTPLVATEATTSQLSVSTGTTADAAWTGTGTATIIAALKGMYNSVNGSLPSGTNLIGSVKLTDGTNTATVTAASALKVDGSAVTQPVSGTVTANQGGTWTVQPGNTANTTAWLVTGTGGTFPVTGTITANQGGNWTSRIVGNAGATLDTSAAQNQAMPTNMLIIGGEFNTSPTGITSGNASPLQLNGSGSLRVDGSGVTQPVSQATAANLNATVVGTGTFAVQAAQSGTWNIGTVTTITNPVAVTQSGTWTVQQGTPPWLVGGDVANAATDSGNPIKVGGVARTANPTAVAAGQRVNAMFDKLGKQVVVSGLREAKGVQKTSITVATEQPVVTAGGAGVFNDVYAIIVTNKSATSVFVDFKDATGGTTRMTIAAPANDTRGITLTVDSAMIQAVAANNWTATVSSAVTSIEITMLFVSNL